MDVTSRTKIVVIFQLVSGIIALENLALDKAAEMSTQRNDDSGAEGAIDGDITQTVSGGTCALTKVGKYKEAWWRVDLNGTFAITELKIYLLNTDLFRFRYYSAHVTDTLDNWKSTYCTRDHHSGKGPNVPIFTLNCDAKGRYVTIWLDRSAVCTSSAVDNACAILQLCEVQVLGCQPGNYSRSCNLTCPTNCRDDLCSIDKGECYQCNDGYLGHECQNKCTAGLYGKDCNQNCNGFCADGKPCSHINGKCINGCMDGYVGEYCNNTCSPGYFGSNCSQICGECINNETCIHTNGTCKNGCDHGVKGLYCNTSCDAGQYGPGCIYNCSVNCVDNKDCDRVTGWCDGGCQPGWIGNTCNRKCGNGTFGLNCSNSCGKCLNNETCNHDNGYCASGCNRGFEGLYCNVSCKSNTYGYNCNQSCSGQCKNQITCNRFNGFCDVGCESGWKGTYCNETCDSGTYGYNCNQTCSGNCKDGVSCNRTDGSCNNGCKPGWKGISCNTTCSTGYFGSNCSQSCGVCLDNETCLRTNGTCVNGCNNGWKGLYCNISCETGEYGPGCINNCSVNCVDSKKCNPISGSCNGGCQPGWTGNSCEEECGFGTFGSNCTKNCGQCLNNATCNHDNGHCDSGCSRGFEGLYCNVSCTPYTYGYNCNQSCNGQCRNQITCNRFNGSCDPGCERGWEGTYCNETCNPETYGYDCEQKCSRNCKGNFSCNRTDGSCNSGCDAGWKGIYCNITCSSGDYGEDCNYTCGQCYNSSDCDRTNGTCYHGCAPGFKGNTCKESCPSGTFGRECRHNCSGNCRNNDVCDGITGICVNGCDRGWEEPHCNESCVFGRYGYGCTESCGHCRNITHCDIYNGSCTSGCENGWTGSTCETRCQDGTYGFQCKAICSDHCGVAPCNKTTGECDIGCQPGWKGIFCNETCTEGTYGTSCTYSCSEHCKGNESCNSLNGSCPSGCLSGWSEENCDQECLPGFFGENCRGTCGKCSNGTSCDRVTGYCTDGCMDGYAGNYCSRNESYIGVTPEPDNNGSMVKAVILSLTLIIATVAVVLLAIYFYRRRGLPLFKRKQNNEADEQLTPPKALYENLSLQEKQRNNTAHCTQIPDVKEDIIEKEPLTEVYSDSLYCNTTISPHDIPLSALQDIIEEKSLTSNKLFREEYMALPKSSLENCTTAQLLVNIKKNRYKTTLAYDHSRVILKTFPTNGTDYINANYIDGVNAQKRYIASQDLTRYEYNWSAEEKAHYRRSLGLVQSKIRLQLMMRIIGPKDNTFRDHWCMIWQEGVLKIVMLTNLVENRKKKCDMYWPGDASSSSMTAGEFTITSESEQVYASLTIRNLRLTNTELKTSRNITHFHFTTWPDHGVPDALELVLFHIRVRDSNVNGPLLVHCSAGIGRTGTFLALDALMEDCKLSWKINVFNYAQVMRRDRMGMIQNVNQYIGVHLAVLEHLRTCAHNIPKAGFADDITTKLKSQTDEYFFKEFQEIEAMKPLYGSEDYKTGLLQKNKTKNYCEDILPVEKYAAFLSTDIDDKFDYINAVYISSYTDYHGFIVTQIPTADTGSDFYRLVLDHNVTTVVALLSDDSDSMMSHLMPDNGSQTTTGAIQVQVESKDTMMKDIVKITMTIQRQALCNTVNVFTARCLRGDIFDNTKLDVLGELTSSIMTTDEIQWQRTVVMSRDGVTGCGLFVTLYNAKEQLHLDHEVDICTIVRRLKIRRPQLCPNLMEYKLCYQAVADYLIDASIYANT